MTAGKKFHFEDLTPGFRFETESVTFSEQEIVAFAQQYDPQSFHTSPIAARDSLFGGIIASGWQVGSATMPLIINGKKGGLAGLIGIEITRLRWPNPVRPGDEVKVRVEVLKARLSNSYPNYGIVNLAFEATNQAGAAVQTSEGTFLVPRRTDK